MQLFNNGWLFSAIGGIATTVRSSFRLNSVRNPWSKNVPFLPRNPMNMNESEHPFFPRNPMNMNEYAICKIAAKKSIA